MKYTPVDLIGGFYTDDSLPWSSQDTVNYLPVMSEVPGTRTVNRLRTPPGLKPYQIIGDGPIRGSINVEGKLFVVSGNQLYQVSNTGVGIPRGAIPGVGRVSMAYNQRGLGNELLIANGSAGYVYNTSSTVLAKITDEAYPGAGSVAYIDSYLAQVEPFGRFWFHSNLANAFDYNSLDRYESEASPDKIVGLIVSQFEVVVFNQTTTEFFANTGAATGTFQSKRIVVERGCAGRFTIAMLDNAPMWLGNDGVVYRMDGYRAVPVSTRAIERAIAEESWADAFAMVWEDEGHKVYYLTFPSGKTWGYDVAQGIWHRRSTYTGPTELAGRWRINTLTYWNGQWIAGDAYSGKLFVLDWDWHFEEVEPLVSERVTGVFHANQNAIVAPYMELVFDTGGLASDEADGVFPVQPEPPSIVGHAPGGAAGDAYLYSYTTTPGTYPILKTILVEGSSDLSLFGLEWDEVTATISGTPIEPGQITLVLRVLDTAGLRDELNDTFNVSLISYALGGIGGSDYRVIRVIDSDDWNRPLLNPELAASGIIAADAGRVIAYNATTARYSDNSGADWLTSTGALGGSGGARGAARKAGSDVVLIGRGSSNGANRSTDNGSTFSLKSEIVRVQYLTYVGERLITAGTTASSGFSYSDDEMATDLVAGGAHGVYLTSGGAIASSGNRAILVGSRISGQDIYCAVTVDGVAVSNSIVKVGASLRGSAVAAGFPGGNEVWVVGGATGEVLVSTNNGGSWTQTFTADGEVTAMEWTGASYTLCSYQSAGPTVGGHVYVSDDGIDWTEITSSLTGRVYGLTVSNE
ncbi:packaged DNA stabilization protein [Pseudoxanthomonas dokdonensis]|uniref:packaged DNA stabilization protein n=1 Tax=Pseudoxanthomonas dokdonensis TaxID=344882 RepID=UPI0014776A3A|nr:packaged DNA stabilization protein [Pseudoxanthomonas dokdonensis]